MIKLFNKEKDLIHRIANLILILWVIVAIFVTYSSVVNLAVKQKVLSYKEYQTTGCYNLSTDDCKLEYQRYEINNKDNDYYNKISLINGLGNVVIVLSALYLLNRKKED
ncbi:MAG: hypothetical protein PHQ89_01055 [Bacilli bacterium]|nr:hypothetical protein [Bacilli bacterium]